MLLSVVLPVRNGLPFVRHAVSSILEQTFTSFELVVVDNLSTDGTAAIVESFRDSRIRLVREPKTGGPTAFNSGWRTAKGTYIARMDADDISLPRRFATQIDYLKAHPNVDIIGSQIQRIDESGNTIGRSRLPTVPCAVHQASRYIFPVSNPTLMFRRELLSSINGYREFSPAADYDMILRAIESGFSVANVPDILLKYRVRKDSVSHSNRMITAQNWAKVRRMAHLRQTRQYGRELKLLNDLSKPPKPSTTWFRAIDGALSIMRDYRAQQIYSPPSRPRLLLVNLAIAMTGSLHPLTARQIWAAYHARRIIGRFHITDDS